jgi:hypothetical protein
MWPVLIFGFQWSRRREETGRATGGSSLLEEGELLPMLP